MAKDINDNKTLSFLPEKNKVGRKAIGKKPLSMKQIAARRREKLAAQGLKQVNLWLTDEQAEEVKKFLMEANLKKWTCLMIYQHHNNE